MGRPRNPDAGDVSTGTPMLIPMTGKEMVGVEAVVVGGVRLGP